MKACRCIEAENSVVARKVADKIICGCGTQADGVIAGACIDCDARAVIGNEIVAAARIDRDIISSDFNFISRVSQHYRFMVKRINFTVNINRVGSRESIFKGDTATESFIFSAIFSGFDSNIGNRDNNIVVVY